MKNYNKLQLNCQKFIKKNYLKILQFFILMYNFIVSFWGVT